MRQIGQASRLYKVRKDKPAGEGIACPRCDAINMTRTVDTRKQNGTIRRRRECVKCGALFYTIETVERAIDA